MLKPETVVEEKSQGRVGLIVIISGLTAFGPFCMDMYLPGLPSLAQDLGGEAWQVQLTLTACLLGLAGGQIIAGPLSDTFGRRRPLLVGLVIYTIASLMCALAPSVLLLILFRFLQGAAGASGIVIARAIVRDLYSGSEVARFFALTMAVNGLAPILAPIVGGQVLNFTSWRGVFVILTMIGLVLLVSVGLGLKETLPLERRHSGGVTETLRTFRHLLANRAFVGYALALGLAFGCMFGYIAGSPFVLENIYNVSPQVFSLIFASNAFGIILTSQISSRLVEKVGSRKLLAFGLGGSLTGGGCLLLAVLTNVGLIGVLPSFFLIVSSIGFVAPNATALALADQRGVAGSASALLGVLQYVIGALITPLVTIGGTHTAVPMAIIIAILGVSSVTVFVVLTCSRVEVRR